MHNEAGAGPVAPVGAPPGNDRRLAGGFPPFGAYPRTSGCRTARVSSLRFAGEPSNTSVFAIAHALPPDDRSELAPAGLLPGPVTEAGQGTPVIDAVATFAGFRFEHVQVFRRSRSRPNVGRASRISPGSFQRKLLPLTAAGTCKRPWCSLKKAAWPYSSKRPYLRPDRGVKYVKSEAMPRKTFKPAGHRRHQGVVSPENVVFSLLPQDQVEIPDDEQCHYHDDREYEPGGRGIPTEYLRKGKEEHDLRLW